MFLLKKLLSAWLLPPLGLLISALLALIFGRGWRSRLVAIVAIATAFLLSLPLIANQLSSSLEGLPVSIDTLNQAQAIVILGAGIHRGAPEYGGDTLSRYSLERVRYGAMLGRKSKLPILVSGGSVYGGKPEASLMRQVLANEFAVPVRWVETESRDTGNNAVYAAKLLRADGIRHVALVTHAWHVPRAVVAFERQGPTKHDAPSFWDGALW
jgi:uncharacterized SAM-binding protein YcdF (DUF218 family)